MLTVKKGNLFSSGNQTIVNTINCVGVMGAGIAYEFRLRYPDMFTKYVELCKTRQIVIGSLWIYKTPAKWVLNFPTKYDWKYPSKIEFLEKGLQKFVETYREKEIESISFPVLGASNGGLSDEISLEIMQKHLSKCDICVDIYQYDPLAYDDLYIKFKKIFSTLSEKEIASKSALGKGFIRKIQLALENEEIRSMSQLLTANGIGDKTLEKSFSFIMNYKEEKKLFDDL